MITTSGFATACAPPVSVSVPGCRLWFLYALFLIHGSRDVRDGESRAISRFARFVGISAILPGPLLAEFDDFRPTCLSPAW